MFTDSRPTAQSVRRNRLDELKRSLAAADDDAVDKTPVKKSRQDSDAVLSDNDESYTSVTKKDFVVNDSSDGTGEYMNVIKRHESVLRNIALLQSSFNSGTTRACTAIHKLLHARYTHVKAKILEETGKTVDYCFSKDATEALANAYIHFIWHIVRQASLPKLVLSGQISLDSAEHPSRQAGVVKIATSNGSLVSSHLTTLVTLTHKMLLESIVRMENGAVFLHGVPIPISVPVRKEGKETKDTATSK